MTATDPGSKPDVEAVATALRPYQWRRFRPELRARADLAAHDRQHLRRLLAGFAGVAVGTWDSLEPADRDDTRMTVLLEFLAAHRWTELDLGSLCRQLLALLDDTLG